MTNAEVEEIECDCGAPISVKESRRAKCKEDVAKIREWQEAN